MNILVIFFLLIYIRLFRKVLNFLRKIKLPIVPDKK